METKDASQPRDTFLSVVIPAYNEDKRIQPTIEQISNYLKGRVRGFEILVVDDGSTDHTVTFVRRMIFKYPAVRIIPSDGNRGKGHAVRMGVLEAKGDMVLITDADLSTPVEEYAKLASAIDSGADVAIGSRAMAGSELMIRQPWYREAMGRAFNSIARMVVLEGIRDTQCGFKLFKTDAARAIFGHLTVDGFAFDVEALYLARHFGYKIAEVPVVWLHSPSSRVSLVGSSLSMLGEVLKVRLNILFKRY